MRHLKFSLLFLLAATVGFAQRGGGGSRGGGGGGHAIGGGGGGMRGRQRGFGGICSAARVE